MEGSPTTACEVKLTGDIESESFLHPGDHGGIRLTYAPYGSSTYQKRLYTYKKLEVL